MPRGDRTGPMGAGPMTGRGAGICAGYNVPGYMNNAFGRGFGGGGGRGFGRGFGFRGRGGGWGWTDNSPYPNTMMPPYNPNAAMNIETSKSEELANLKEQANYLKSALEDISRRIDQL